MKKSCTLVLLFLNAILLSCIVVAFPSSAGGEVYPGIDGDLSVLYDQKVGLVTNPTGLNSKLDSTIDVLFKNPRIQLTALFGMV